MVLGFGGFVSQGWWGGGVYAGMYIHCCFCSVVITKRLKFHAGTLMMAKKCLSEYGQVMR